MTKRRYDPVSSAFRQLDDDRLARRLVGKGRLQRQHRIPGLRRLPRSVSLHPVLMTEWLCAAAAEGKSPALLLAEMLCDRWGYNREDV